MYCGCPSADGLGSITVRSYNVVVRRDPSHCSLQSRHNFAGARRFIPDTPTVERIVPSKVSLTILYMFTYFLLLTAYCGHIWSWSLIPNHRKFLTKHIQYYETRRSLLSQPPSLPLQAALSPSQVSMRVLWKTSTHSPSAILMSTVASLGCLY